MIITWSVFVYFAVVSMLLWFSGALLIFKRKIEIYALSLFLIGILVFLVFVAGLWINMKRPPMCTMGETRLLYSLFVVILVWGIYLKWHYRWLLLFGAILSSVFIIINLFKPEIHDKSLMPALQSIWFVPHVSVYMLAYAMLACALLLAVYASFNRQGIGKVFSSVDNLVRIGASLLLIGMLMGAVWAKHVWGHYWDWDPKEIWAAITWLGYLLYLHFRLQYPQRYKTAVFLLILSFLFLQICWYGLKYLPLAQNSLHFYSY